MRKQLISCSVIARKCLGASTKPREGHSFRARARTTERLSLDGATALDEAKTNTLSGWEQGETECPAVAQRQNKGALKQEVILVGSLRRDL